MMKRSLVVLAALASVSAWAQGEYPFCQIMDRVDDPAWAAQGSFVVPADVTPVGKSLGIFDLSGGGGIGYFRSDLGDIDLTGDYDVMLLDGSGGINLPDQLGSLSLTAALTCRNADGQALRLSASPGIYSDLQEAAWKSFYVPFAVEGIQTFSPEVSGVLGLAFFPGFDQFVDPRIGIRWAVNDVLLIDLMYPESRITVAPAEGWELYTGIKSSQTPEWNLDDGRGSLSMDEMRAYVGVAHPLNEQFRMMYQAGLVFDREIEFAHQSPKYGVDDAVYLTVGIGGAL